MGVQIRLNESNQVDAITFQPESDGRNIALEILNKVHISQWAKNPKRRRKLGKTVEMRSAERHQRNSSLTCFPSA